LKNLDKLGGMNLKKSLASTLLFAISLAMGASANAVAFGIKGGVAFSKTNAIVADYGFGFLGGLSARFPSQPVGLEIDAFFARRVYKFHTTVNTQTLQSVYVPVLANFQVARIISLMGGGYFSYRIGDAKNVGASAGVYDAMGSKAMDFGMVFGVGCALSNSFTVEARYSGGMADAYESSAAIKNSAFDLLVGFSF
jgi:hypothetical protein